jgi:hypothetical protein
VIDHVDSYDELVSRIASMTTSLENEKAITMNLKMQNSILKKTCDEQEKLINNLSSSHDSLFRKLANALEKEMAKTMKLKDENSFLKNSCEQQKHLLYVTSGSHDELKLTHELCETHENLLQDHALLTKKFSNEQIKTSESSSHGSVDQLHIIANPCDVGKKHVSTSCDGLLSMPCSSYIDACSSSMSCETNLLKENNELKEKVMNLSNKLERWNGSKVTHEQIVKNQRSHGDRSGIGFNKSKASSLACPCTGFLVDICS